MKIKKKIMSLALMVTLLTGCSSIGGTTEDEGKETITVWAWDKNFNIRVMEEAASIYEEKNPDVDIEIVDYARADIETKLHTNLATGSTKNLPDIVLIEDYSAQKFLTSYPGMFEDLTESIDYSNFAQYKVSPMTVDGKTYGLPFDSGVTAMFYRKDYLEEAGYKSEDLENITWEEYLEIGKDIKEKTGKYIASENLNESSGFARIMMQQAGTWYFDENTDIKIEGNEVLKENLEVFKTMKETGVVKSVNGWDEWVGAMNDGTSATVISGAWIMPSIMAAEDQSGKWGVAPIPKLSTVDSVQASNVGGSSWYVVGGKDNKDTSIDFLNSIFAGNDDFYQTILTDIGAIGTYLPSQTGSAYEKTSEFFSGEQIYQKFSKWMKEVPQVNYGVYVGEADQALHSVMGDVYSGNLSVEEALKKIQDQVSNQIK